MYSKTIKPAKKNNQEYIGYVKCGDINVYASIGTYVKVKQQIELKYELLQGK